MTTNALVRRRPTEVAGLIDRMPNVVAPAAPALRVRWLAVWLFVLGFALFGVLGTWAATAPMRSAVVASGLFRVSGDRLVVQHLEGGMVSEIAVKEGDLVRQGDVILRLDDTRPLAALGILQNQLIGALATEARLHAEFNEARHIELSDELTRMIEAEPSFASVVATQLEVFTANQRLAEGQVQILQDRIAQLEGQKAGIEHRLVAQQAQLELIQDEVNGLEQLYEKGLVTKSQYLTMRRSETAMMGDIEITQTQMQSVLQQIAENEERKLQVRRDRLIEITDGRRIAGESIYDIRQRIDAAQDAVDRLTIRAPNAGRIVGLNVNTIGEVIESADRLVEIVPADSDYVVEVRVSPTDINQVFEGGEARVRLTAYNFRTTPTVLGEVTHVSADSFTDEKTGQAYFKADIHILDGQLAALKDVEISPGMPAQVMISTGEQTLADYLLSPVLGGMEVALSESE